MKNILFYAVVFILASCHSPVEKTTVTDTIQYPSQIENIFNAHGGIGNWDSFKQMSFEIKSEEGNEKQLIDLEDRRERIDAPDFIMGYTGKEFWIEADTSVKTSPVFYKNLMFYFYAMPFVLADPGINYAEVDVLNFDGVDYPGYRISYNSNVGVSPEDEYYIHFDSKTNRMAWLGYTVTYFSKEKSTKIKWIRYDDWKDIQGLILPKTMAWYTTENNQPIELRNRLEFEKVKLSSKKLNDDAFMPTSQARIVGE